MMDLQRHAEGGKMIYSFEGASLVIKDDKFPGFSIVPAIVDMQGPEDSLLQLLSYMTSKVKSPLLAKNCSHKHLLLEYGFHVYGEHLVWDLEDAIAC